MHPHFKAQILFALDFLLILQRHLPLCSDRGCRVFLTTKGITSTASASASTYPLLPLLLLLQQPVLQLPASGLRCKHLSRITDVLLPTAGCREEYIHKQFSRAPEHLRSTSKGNTDPLHDFSLFSHCFFMSIPQFILK